MDFPGCRVVAYGVGIGAVGHDTLGVTFHGVRGSTPCHGPDTVRYGGNTSCVSLTVPGHDPLLFDLGTGLRYFGNSVPSGRPFRGTCLLSHYHWDHVQGLPFFTPLLRPGSHLDVYGPVSGDVSAADAMNDAIRPPRFPVTLDQLPGTVAFHDVDRLAPGDDGFVIESAEAGVPPIEVLAREVPHTDRTAGYRVTWNGRTVTYLSDHQQPVDGSFTVSDGALQLCEGADVLIHDAQFTTAEFSRRADWGHSTVEYAVWVAATTSVKTLVLFHHDPMHHDDLIDVLAANAAACAGPAGVEVVAAHEGLVLFV